MDFEEKKRQFIDAVSQNKVKGVITPQDKLFWGLGLKTSPSVYWKTWQWCISIIIGGAFLGIPAVLLVQRVLLGPLKSSLGLPPPSISLTETLIVFVVVACVSIPMWNRRRKRLQNLIPPWNA